MIKYLNIKNNFKNMVDYPREQLWEIYENLPEDLRHAIFAEENSDKIYDICVRNGVNEDNKISEIAKYIGYVMLGVLPPDELEKTIKGELNLEEKIAKQIVWEISRFVFFPIKNSLELLYKIEITPKGKHEGERENKESVEIKHLTDEEFKEKMEKEQKEDIYREQIE